MAKISISKAARLAGVARSNFYTTYIKKGRISVSKDAEGKKFIDTSELLRVFPDIKQDTSTEQQDSKNRSPVEQDRTPDLALENKLLHQQIAALQKDKEWLQDQVTNLTDSIKLLEAPKQSRLWWQLWK